MRDRNALHQFHHEIGATGLSAAGVEHLGDIRVVHQRQSLTLGLKAGDELARVHSLLDDLHRHTPFDGPQLLGQINDTHAAFAKLLQQLVRPDHGTGNHGDLLILRDLQLRRGRFQKTIGLLVRGQQRIDSLPKSRVIAANFVQVPIALVLRLDFQGVVKDRLGTGVLLVHGESSGGAVPLPSATFDV